MAKGIKLRNWSLDARDYQTDDEFRAAVELELARFEHIGERFGIGLIAAPIKERVTDRRSGRVSYVTVGWTFQTATIPAVHEPEPDPEPDPVVVEELEQIVDEPEDDVAPADPIAEDDPYAES